VPPPSHARRVADASVGWTSACGGPGGVPAQRLVIYGMGGGGDGGCADGGCADGGGGG